MFNFCSVGVESKWRLIHSLWRVLFLSGSGSGVHDAGWGFHVFSHGGSVLDLSHVHHFDGSNVLEGAQDSVGVLQRSVYDESELVLVLVGSVGLGGDLASDLDSSSWLVNVVYRSSVALDHLSAADSDSHEFVAILHDGVSVDWVLLGLGLVQPWVKWAFVGKLSFLNLSEHVVLVHGRLSNWDDLFDDVPQNSFGARDGGQRSWVSPSSVELENFDEFLEVKVVASCSAHSHVFELSGGELRQESIVVLDIEGKSHLLDSVEEGLWNNLKEESQNTVAELRWLVSLGEAALKSVDNMHLQIQKFSVNGVFGWRVEMILQTVEFGLWNVLVEERDGLGLHEALFGGLVSVLGVKLVEEGVSLLVELGGGLRVDVLVVEVEDVISKTCVNLHLGFEIDWSLLGSKSLAWVSVVEIGGVGVLWGIVKSLEEADSRSLSSWVLS